MFVVKPTVVNVAAAPIVGEPINVGSNSNFSAPYPDPPSITSKLVIEPPAITTFAVAPSQVVVPVLNNLMFWYVPFVYPVPPVKSL